MSLFTSQVSSNTFSHQPSPLDRPRAQSSTETAITEGARVNPQNLNQKILNRPTNSSLFTRTVRSIQHCLGRSIIGIDLLLLSDLWTTVFESLDYVAILNLPYQIITEGIQENVAGKKFKNIYTALVPQSLSRLSRIAYHHKLSPHVKSVTIGLQRPLHYSNVN